MSADQKWLSKVSSPYPLFFTPIFLLNLETPHAFFVYASKAGVFAAAIFFCSSWAEILLLNCFLDDSSTGATTATCSQSVILEDDQGEEINWLQRKRVNAQSATQIPTPRTFLIQTESHDDFFISRSFWSCSIRWETWASIFFLNAAEGTFGFFWSDGWWVLSQWLVMSVGVIN